MYCSLGAFCILDTSIANNEQHGISEMQMLIVEFGISRIKIHGLKLYEKK